MPRLRVQICGDHPLLPLLLSFYVEKRFEIVEENPDFYVVGAGPTFQPETCPIQEKTEVPGLILSTDSVYSCLGLDLKVREPGVMKEEDALIVPSTLEYSTLTQTKAIFAEAYCRSLFKGNSIILRPFGVYGPGCPDTIISELLRQALQNQTLEVYKPAHRKRTFLYVEDFLLCIEKVTQALLDGHFGLYNVGSSEVISIHNLAESIYQFVTKSKETPTFTYKKQEHFINFWKIPDTTRVKAVFRWKPTTTIRGGVWHTLNLITTGILE